MNTTELEKKLLINIAENQYQDGRDPEEMGPIWSNALDIGPMNIIGKQISGVASSLSKKGLVICDGEKEDSCIRLTKEGVTAYYEARKFFPKEG
jgi:hypothetical protein